MSSVSGGDARREGVQLSTCTRTNEAVANQRLHESTGAEIETALCILESVLPTLVSTRYYTRKLDLGICGSLLLRPATQEGSSENRKLGIWNLGYHLP